MCLSMPGSCISTSSAAHYIKTHYVHGTKWLAALPAHTFGAVFPVDVEQYIQARRRMNAHPATASAVATV